MNLESSQVRSGRWIVVEETADTFYCSHDSNARRRNTEEIRSTHSRGEHPTHVEDFCGWTKTLELETKLNSGQWKMYHILEILEEWEEKFEGFAKDVDDRSSGMTESLNDSSKKWSS